MKVLKTFGAEKTQQLDHRLRDQLGIKAIEAGMVHGGDPIGDELQEVVGGNAGMGDRHDFEKTGFAKRRQRLDIAVDAMDEHVARWRAPSDSRTTAAAPASAALA